MGRRAAAAKRHTDLSERDPGAHSLARLRRFGRITRAPAVCLACGRTQIRRQTRRRAARARRRTCREASFRKAGDWRARTVVQAEHVVEDIVGRARRQEMKHLSAEQQRRLSLTSSHVAMKAPLSKSGESGGEGGRAWLNFCGRCSSSTCGRAHREDSRSELARGPDTAQHDSNSETSRRGPPAPTQAPPETLCAQGGSRTRAR